MQKLLRQIHYRPKTSLSISIFAAAVSITISYSTAIQQTSASRLQNTGRRTFASSMSDPPRPSSGAAATQQWTPRSYETLHAEFPYNADDFKPMDARPDGEFYSTPRFVTHIDDHAIMVLRRYYGAVLPDGPADTPDARKPHILDLCSSWVSHYPRSMQDAVGAGDVVVAGIGMNAAELKANPLFGHEAGNRYLLKDLNQAPEIPAFRDIHTEAGGTQSSTAETVEDGPVDATTLTVSIDYLTLPVPVLRSLLERTRNGGTVHVAVSNRCFPTKAVRKWLSLSEKGRLEMVAELLVWSGWKEVEILCLCDGSLSEEEQQQQQQQQQQQAIDDADSLMGRIMSGMGMGVQGARVDPIWIVRGRKIADR